MKYKLESIALVTQKIIRCIFMTNITIMVLSIIKLCLFFLFKKSNSFISNLDFLVISQSVIYMICSILLLSHYLIIKWIHIPAVNLYRYIELENKMGFVSYYYSYVKRHFKYALVYKIIRDKAEVYINEL